MNTQKSREWPVVILALKQPFFLLVLLGLLGTGLYWGYKQVSRPLFDEIIPACVPVTVGEFLTPDRVVVRVFNGGTVTGKAASIQSQLHGVGFQTPYSGNAKDPSTVTKVIGFAVDAPEVQLVAGFFPGATIEVDARPDHAISVIIADETTINLDAPRQIAVPGQTACVPSEAAPETKATETPAETATDSVPVPAPDPTVPLGPEVPASTEPA